VNPSIVRAALLAVICCVGLNGCVVAALGAVGAGTFLAANSDDFQGDGRPRQSQPPQAASQPAPAYQPPAQPTDNEPEAAPTPAPSGGPIQSEPLN
jgi:hypothetical protein